MIFAADPHPIATYAVGCVFLALAAAVSLRIIIGDLRAHWRRIYAALRGLDYSRHAASSARLAPRDIGAYMKPTTAAVPTVPTAISAVAKSSVIPLSPEVVSATLEAKLRVQLVGGKSRTLPNQIYVYQSGPTNAR